MSTPDPRQQDPKRKIGVEIEFAGLAPDAAAKVVADCLGGQLDQGDLYFWTVTDTSIGDVDVELDTQYVKAGNNPLQKALETASEELGVEIRRLIGSASEGLVPTEIVSPPIPVGDLPEMDKLVSALRDAGAEDSTGSPLSAFGLHLNPEIIGEGVGDILPTFQAYMLMSAWLRDQIGIDLARKALPYIDPFPHTYVKHATSPDYKPDLADLIEDYLAENATRNRELDMLPLFAHMDEARVRDTVGDPRIKPRPTFHYRLPEARLSDPDWSIQKEWDRWLLVEKLAGETQALNGLADLYQNTPPRKWLETSRDYITDWLNNDQS